MIEPIPPARSFRPRSLSLALLLFPSLALADARVEARRHFKSGMALIQAGEYERGIEALLEAYSVKPHPNVLFNIARAYESAGQVKEAIDHYRRYLRSKPADAEAVRASLARLEASLPKEAEKPPQPPPPPANKVDEEALRRLSLLAERLEELVGRAERAALPPPASEPVKPEPEGEPEESDWAPYSETVVTASRRAQSTLEAPNATTIITAEEIRLSGARSLPELLRRVPGAEVAVMGVGSANLSFRGFNQRIANKVLVLLDGRTEYQDFLGITLWPAVPVGLEEIERIEVIRGPGSALYGANAMLGVVNIITRPAGTGPGAELSALAGSGNVAQGSFLASGSQQGLRYRASVGYQQASKWSRDMASGRPDVASQSFDSSLGLRSARGNLTAQYALSREATLSASMGVNRLFTEIYPLGVLRNYYLDGLSSYTKADLGTGPLKLGLFWNHMTASAGPQYGPIGQRSLFTQLRSNVFDAELQLGQKFSLLGAHRLELGASARQKDVRWGYLSGPKSELHLAAFVQDEWRLFEPLWLVASYRVDRHPLLDHGNPGYAQSPRVSLLWLFAEGHSLRAAAATAFRVPTFLESYTEIRIPLPGVNGGSLLTTGSPTLRPERLAAYEVGYRGELAEAGLDFELTAYQNHVTDLVSITPPARLPPEQTWDAQSGTYLFGHSSFANEPLSYTARGVELGVKYTPVDRLDLKASAAWQRVGAEGGPAVCGPCTQAPQLKLFGSASYRSRSQLELSLDGSFTSATIWVEREPAPDDPTQIVPLQNLLPEYLVLNARVAYQLWQERLSLGLLGTHLGPSHAQHPFGNLIERRLLATLTVTP